MEIIKKLALLMVVACGFVACVSEADNNPVNPSEQIEEVGFVMPMEATRTAIGPDGMSTRWAEGDKLSVWALNSEGNYTFENTQFTMRYFSPEYDKAYFVSNISEMPEGDYTYFLSYPKPVSVNGTQVTYSVSSVQSGAYDGKYDIMIAEPAKASALSATHNVELNTIMRHQMHAVKITVPEGRNLYGGRFYRLEITFPEGSGVVGDITFDVANPEAKPTYSNLSNVVAVESAEGFDAGSEIWVFVLPGSVDGDVSYRVRGERRHSNVATYSLSKEFVKGRITPINMAIPEIYPLYTAVTFSVDQNNLGEEFNFFDVYDANGNHMGQFARNAENKYIVDYEGEFDADQYDNTSWRIVFDSEHAIVETSVNLGDMTDYSEHARWMNVPYLFAEDFTSLATFDADYTDGPYTSVEGAATAGHDLTAYGLSAGWTGARVGCNAAGSAILVAGRVDCVVLGATRTYGRLDSPAMATIKEGATVNVQVSFDYGGSRSGSSTYYPVGRAGFTKETGALSAYATQFNNNEAFANIDGASTVPNIPTSGSATALTQSMTYNINGCTSEHRLSWHVGNMGYKSLRIDNGYSWMYVDNIKVQIAK